MLNVQRKAERVALLHYPLHPTMTSEEIEVIRIDRERLVLRILQVFEPLRKCKKPSPEKSSNPS
jgi:hypothetical protein